MKRRQPADIKACIRIALSAGLICVCAWIAVPFAVPFTMQTLGVFCAPLLLGGKRGTVSIGLYLFIGMTGLPVFSGFRGGIGHLLGPTGGYIIGFLFIGIVYALTEPFIEKHPMLRCAALGLGLIVCYIIGTLWFVFVSGTQAANGGFFGALGICVLPYVIPDCVKMALALFVCGRVRPYLFPGGGK